ncbi:MAG TPA: CDP-alcohol phosphatidyltransferase family protein [Sandaracinaceae bacterium LLY-WYZ-13_1]|nr:CDP-alcohol phosphatidyltransferase family protein [Sandaracinaceae bacterium LLY-WYZ-13_1]
MATDPRTGGRLTANLLSLARIPLAGLLWVFPHSPYWVLAILGLAGISDALDGFVVRRWMLRRWKERDPGAYAASVARGEVIDGVADKIFVVSAVVLLAWVTQPAAWVLLVLVTREALFVPLMVVYRLAPQSLRDRVDFTAGVPGKAATLAQFVALVLGVLEHPLFVESAIGAGALGGLAALYYAVRAFVVTPEPAPE